MNDALRSVILSEQKLQVALVLFTQVARPSAGSWFLASQMFFVFLLLFFILDLFRLVHVIPGKIMGFCF